MTKEQKIENFKKTPHYEGFLGAIEAKFPHFLTIEWCKGGEYNKAVVGTVTYDASGDRIYDYLIVSCDFENNYKLEII